MPRYFFHLRDGTVEIRDSEGEEFASVAEAQAHARLVVEELTRNTPPAQALSIGKLVVIDAEGKEVFEIPLM